jgi:hypothetical protein
MKSRQLNTTNYPITFLMIDSTSHISGALNAAPVVSISKNGSAFAVAAGSVWEIGKGWYGLSGNATDRNTLGAFIINATGINADPFDDVYAIIGSDPFAASVAVSGGFVNNVGTVNNIVNATGLVTVDVNPIVTGVWSAILPGLYPANSAGSGLARIRVVTDTIQFTNQNINTYVSGYQTSQSPASQILINSSNKLWTYSDGAVSGVNSILNQFTFTGNLVNSYSAISGSVSTNIDPNAIISGVWRERLPGLYPAESAGSGLASIKVVSDTFKFTNQNVNAYISGYQTSQSPASQILLNPSNKLYTYQDGAVSGVNANADRLTFTNTLVNAYSASSGSVSATVDVNAIVTGVWSAILPGSYPANSAGSGLARVRVTTDTLKFTNQNVHTYVSGYQTAQSPGEQVLANPNALLHTELVTGYVRLESAGLDSITTTIPSTVASTFPEMVIMVHQKLYGDTAMIKLTATSGVIRVRNTAGTLITSQSFEDDGTTQHQGKAT